MSIQQRLHEFNGRLNEFRHFDATQTIPLGVPVTSGETFVVSLDVFDQTAGDIFTPTFVYDLDGCQPNRNAVDVIPGGWIDSCLAGVTGDWMIRAVVECVGCPADLAQLLGSWGRCP